MLWPDLERESFHHNVLIDFHRKKIKPRKSGWELEPEARKMGWFWGSKPLVFAKMSQGAAGWAAPSSATSSQRGWVLGFCFLTCLVCDLGAFPQAVNYRKRVGMGEMPWIPLEP